MHASLAGKVAFATKRFSEKYTVMCHENALLFMTTNDMPKPIVGVISFAALATRGSVAKTPYFPETISCLALILGESHDSGRNLGWDGNGKKTTIPNESRESS